VTAQANELSDADERPAPNTCLTVRNLTRPGLGPISISLDRGDCLAVSGPSGAGKTLLLRAIADLDPNTGTILLAGQDREAMGAPQWRRKVAYVPTDPGWWANTVGKHFADWAAASPLAVTLGLPAECAGWTVQRLSTGERQRLGLIRALVHEPELLLLDEPTSGLDTDATEAVEAMIAEIRRDRGTAILWVTHDGAQAERVASRRMTIENGQCR
jgi:phosphate-transporting ATPase